MNNSKYGKNVLFVYPQIPANTYWSFKHALKFINKKSAMPPLGLITIAGFFPKSYNLRLVDMNIEPLDESHILWADFVFTGAMIVQKESFQNVVKVCNKLGKPVVAGGPYPTSSYSEISGVSHFVIGEVEDIFNKFLDDLENGKADYIYRSEKTPDISNSILPRFDLLNMDAYGSMSIQYSRGCPFKCEFCDIWKNYGNTPRLKSSKSILNELDSLYDLGWTGAVFVVDDNFIGNKKRVKSELLPALIKWQEEHNHIYRFFTEASINMASDEELLCLMRDAGFNEVFIGIETPSKEGLKETGKSQNISCNMEEAVQKIQSYGIEVMAGFIIGFDSDTDDIFDRQISFIQKTGIPKAMIGLLNALPGTALYQRMQTEGRLLDESNGNNTHSMETNFITKMEKGKLKTGYMRVLKTLYGLNLKNYFNRCSTLLDNIGNNSKLFKRKVEFKEIQMLLRSFFIQGSSRYGYQYMKFLMRNFIKHMNTFPEAVRMCIEGHHFYMITQESLEA
ncbi:MAG: B12-binding domain-containing radical SAM protein [Desulfobacterales bacterium]|nr:B12-binding domain-containing radical SAM protein [Desulfobacterales bacterium]MBF0398714.1 B12-binding domain-containing radical SAM protein [Desulfobacterales bacterium]